MKTAAILFIIIFMTATSYSQQPTSASLGNLRKMKILETGLTIETSFGNTQEIV